MYIFTDFQCAYIWRRGVCGIPALRAVQIKSEVKDDIGGDIPAVCVEACTRDGTTAYGVAETEAVACRKLDKVDDVQSDSEIPARLNRFSGDLFGISLAEAHEE